MECDCCFVVIVLLLNKWTKY